MRAMHSNENYFIPPQAQIGQGADPRMMYQ